MNNVHFAIPEIYGDSLSYYELLRKLVDKTNDLIDNYNTVPEQIAEAVANLDASQLFSTVLNQLIHSIATDNTKSANAVKVYKKHDLLYATFNETVNLYESLIDFTSGTETELIVGTNIREVNISELFIELRKLIDINKNNIEAVTAVANKNTSEITTINDYLAKLKTYVTPEMFGAVGDGITDDTAAINRSLENCENKILYFTKTYLIDGAVTTDIIDNHGLKVRSNTVIRFMGDSKIIQKPSNAKESHIFILLGCENVDISGGCIEGDYLTHTTVSGTTDEWCHGINVISSKNIHIHDMTIKNCYGDGIYIGQSDTRVSSIPADNHCKNITLENVIIDKCGRNGIALTDCNGWRINNIKISNVQRTEPKSGIDIEVEGNYNPFVSTGVISNIKTESCVYGIKLINNSENITIENCVCNRMYPNSNSGIIYITNCNAPLSINNTVVNIYDSAIRGFQGEGDNLCSMYNSSLSILDGQSAKLKLYLLNTIVESVFNFPKSLTMKNCIIKHDGTTNYCVRLAGEKAILDGCIFVINDNINQTPINDSTKEKLTVINCHIEGNATNIAYPFVSTSKTAYINNNNYYPCNSASSIAPIEGCVNFSY